MSVLINFKKILENTKYVMLLSVVSTLVASVFLFIWAAIKMFLTVYHLFEAGFSAESGTATAHLVAVLDMFLFAVILYIFAIAIYELFIGELKLPQWLVIKNLDDLKKKLSSVIALMLSVTFLEHAVKWTDPQGTLMFGAAIGIVIFALIFYMKSKEEKE